MPVSVYVQVDKPAAVNVPLKNVPLAALETVPVTFEDMINPNGSMQVIVRMSPAVIDWL